MVRITRVSAFRVISASDFWGRTRLAPMTAVVLGLIAPHAVFADGALPQGGSVVQGQVAIGTPAPGAMVLDQSTDRAIVNWNGFSIGQGNSVDIRQPSTSSAILNRVTGDTTSEIHGRLSATGQVFVVNPNGLIIGKQGEVSAGGGFVGSTLDTKDSDFMAGRLRFDGLGTSAEVSNAGRVVIGRGGFAALLGGRVSNSGLVMVPMGRIGFGGGERATLDLSGDRFLQVEVPSEGDTDEMRALIENSGTVSAEGGLIEMRAATARDAARNAINLSGVAEARSVSVHNGTIVLGGGDGGRVRVTGRVSTQRAAPSRPDIIVETSKRPLARRGGGDVTIIGHQIELAGARIEASGENGGGTIRIGGDYMGQGTLPHALYLGVDADTVITADAGQSGDGGQVILWSDDVTAFDGFISARGGAEGGDGGSVEVSGKRTLAFTGRVNTLAPEGRAGTLLLDPRNVVISGDPSSEPPFCCGVYTPTADDSVLNVAELVGNLETTNVVVNTGADGVQNGDITVAADINWTAATQLAFEAVGNVVLNAAVNNAAGDFEISAGGTITTDAAGTVNVNQFSLVQGDWSQIAATLPAFSAQDFQLTQSVDTSFLRALSGDGTVALPYALADIYGVQGIGSQTLLDQNFTLAGPIDATQTAGWNGGEGFVGIEGLGFTGFSGSLDGQGNSIDGLTQDVTTAGMFALTRGAQISNLTLNNVSIAGNADTGGLVALAIDTQIDNVQVSGAITAQGATVAGGIVGELRNAASTLSNSSFTGTLDLSGAGESSLSAGGLVGNNNLGTVSDSTVNAQITETGAVFGSRDIGGAVGTNRGVMTTVGTQGALQSTAEGATLVAGGLAGRNLSLEGITDSTSAMNVTIRNTSLDTAIAGGLVGSNIGTVTGTQSNGTVSVSNAGGFMTVGGLIGANTSTLVRPVDNNVATGNVTVNSISDSESFRLATVGGMFGRNNGPANANIATGDVTVSSRGVPTRVGGFVGLNSGETEGSGEGQIARSYATGAVSVEATQDSEVGGFAGLNDGTIVDAFASGSVGFTAPVFARGDASTPQQADIGGFAGASTNDMNRTAARGDVLVSSDDVQIRMGGHTGYNSFGQILNSYAGGSVVSTSGVGQQVGGLVGVTTSGAITNTYATGLVSANGAGAAQTGGLIGVNTPPATFGQTVVTASYWDTERSGQADGGLAELGFGLTTAQFRDTDGFFALAGAAGWDFADVWAPGGTGTDPAIYTIDRVIFAMPDPLDLTYGETTGATATGSIAGGPEVYVFADTGETLDTAPVFDTLTFADETVGTQAFSVDTSPLTSSTARTWSVVALSGSVDITPAPLELTANDATKTYGTALTFDGTEFAVTGGTLFFADSVDTIGLSSAGSVADAQVGDGPYTIENTGGIAGSGLENYAISFVEGTLDVTRAPLELTVNDATKTYGTALSFDGTEFTVTGGALFFADSVDSIGIASAGAAADAQVADGPFAITGSAPVTGTRTDNYDIAILDGTLDVTRAPLELTVNDATKTYGTALAFDGTEFTVTGGALFFADSVDSIGIASAGAAADAQVADGPFAITGSAPVTGTRTDNYDIAILDGTLDVTRAPLELTVNDATKTYGTALAFDGTEFTVTGGALFFADSVDSIGIASAGAAADAQVADGPFAITGSAPVTGTRTDNYDIAILDGTLDVTRAPLELTVNDATKTYGTALAFDGTEFTVTGGALFFADSVDSIGIASAGAAADAQVADGPFAITGSAPVSGTRTDNYDIAILDGTLDVTRAPLELTVNDATKTYGTALSFDGTEFTVTGGALFFADSVDSIGIASAGAAADAQVADGPFAITGSAPVSGTRTDNYDIAILDGTLDVTRAPLELTADDATKTEGSVLTFAGTEFSADGLLFGDTVTRVDLSSDGAAAQASAADSPYAIVAGSPEGSGLENYDIRFTDGTLTVERTAPITSEPTISSATASFGLPNPTDTIVLTVPGGGPVASAPASAGNGSALRAARETLQVVQGLSTSFEVAAAGCNESSDDVTRYMACLSDALNDFANELDAISTDLPPAMQDVARIIRDAQRSVAQARIRAERRLAGATSQAQREQIARDAFGEARAALDTAAGEIRKSISLVRAEDPELAAVQRATIVTVAAAIDNAGIELSRATGL
ncbi:Heme/hemopexin-binding protein (plasmid) [Pseudosulfitobacter sp. DSM 107133]|nr:Heme/hemopexin-binding protein [Pseudosulfitobacter sp. DSM 107133]